MIDGDYSRQNIFQTVILYIVADFPFVGALFDEFVVLLIVQLHPLDFLVQRFRIFEIRFPVVAQVEQQVNGPFR